MEGALIWRAKRYGYGEFTSRVPTNHAIAFQAMIAFRSFTFDEHCPKKTYNRLTFIYGKKKTVENFYVLRARIGQFSGNS